MAVDYDHHTTWDAVIAAHPDVARWWAWATEQVPDLRPPDEWDPGDVVVARHIGAIELEWTGHLTVTIYPDDSVWIAGGQGGFGHNYDQRLINMLMALQ